MIDPTGKELLAQDSYEFETIKGLVEDTCKLGKLEKVYEIFGGYVNRSFGIEMTGNDGEPIDYFVRRYRSTQSEADIIAEHELIDYCYSKGLDIAAYLIKMPDDKTFTWIKNEQDGENYPWAVYRYLYGEDPYDWLNTNMEPEKDYNFGALQSRLHNSAYGFTGGEKEEPPIYEFLSARKDYFAHCADGKDIPERDRYLLCYNEFIGEILENCDKAKKGLEDSGMLEEGKGYKSVCHCDYHPANVKWDGDECIGIFDFDWSKVDYRLFDICFGMVYTHVAWECMIDGQLHMDRAKIFIKGYNDYSKEKGVLPPFTEEEKKAFPYMFLAAIIYLFNWSTDYFNFPDEYDEYEWYYYLGHIIRAMRFTTEHLDDLYKMVCEACE
ncbi:MAG: phosphotransferase [Bacillota bacterium]|jgi:homoserine kinase type II